MCLIWNLIKAFTDTEDDNKKDNNDLEDWQKELVKEKKYDTFNFEETKTYCKFENTMNREDGLIYLRNRQRECGYTPTLI